jgi:hypothetical protein
MNLNFVTDVKGVMTVTTIEGFGDRAIHQPKKDAGQEET